MRTIPEFEGETPRGLWLSLSGTITDETSQPPDIFHLGQELVMVVRVNVCGVKHTHKKDDLIRQHIVTVEEAHLVNYPVLRDARVATDAERIRLSGADRLPFYPPADEAELVDPYDGAEPDLDRLALPAGSGERVDPEPPAEILDVDPDTGEILARTPIVPLTPKQRGALLMLARHAAPPIPVRQSNKTECSVASHMAGLCSIYWQHVANLVEKGYATLDVDRVEITEAGALRAVDELRIGQQERADG